MTTDTARRVIRQLRMITQFALVGCVIAGATSSFLDPEHIETYRALGASIGAGGSIVTGVYRVL